MGADDLSHAPTFEVALPRITRRAPAPRVLCYVNHFYGPSAGFAGKSTSQTPQARKAIVERCLASVREAIPQAEIRVCGVPGRSLIPVDVPFAGLEDPRQLVYASLNRMADEVDRYDWFINLEDDIELRPQAWKNAQEFEPGSLPNECLLPNRLELREGRALCVDLLAMPGWTTQQQTFKDRTFRVALNPHSALLMLSRAKLRYALRHVDRSYRGPVIGGLMASAYAHFHRPLSLYRCFDDPEFHSVVHLDHWAGPAPEGSTLLFSAVLSASRAQNLEHVVRELRQLPQIGEILVWNDDPERRLDLPGAMVFEGPRGFAGLPRYCLVPLARFDNLWLQDDSVLIRPRQFGALLAAYARDPSRIYGCRGHNLRDGSYLAADAWGEVDVVDGQAMMFHRSLFQHRFPTLASAPVPDEDIAFSLSCRRRHVAVNLGPLEELAPAPQPRDPQATVDRVLSGLRAHPPADDLLAAGAARVDALTAELESIGRELERCRAESARWAGSVTFRAAAAVKRLPLVYRAYLRLKALIR